MTPARDFIVTLRGSPLALRSLLKAAWRQHGLKCIALKTTPRPERRKPTPQNCGDRARRPAP